MPSSHRVTMRPAPNVILPDVDFTFGMSFPKPRARILREGFGFDIELPAVLDLLAGVENGTLKAGDVSRICAASRRDREPTPL